MHKMMAGTGLRKP